VPPLGALDLVHSIREIQSPVAKAATPRSGRPALAAPLWPPRYGRGHAGSLCQRTLIPREQSPRKRPARHQPVRKLAGMAKAPATVQVKVVANAPA
jgi:hypothetical protein